MVRSRLRPSYALLTAVVVLSLGAAGCGADDDEPSATPTAPATSASSPATGAAVPTTPPSPTPTVTSTDGTGLGLQPVAGVPTDFPTADVPLLPGDVRQPLGAGSGTTAAGKRGWVLEVDLTHKPGPCFTAAAKALTGHGFTQQPGGFTSGGTRQAQFTGPGYAVIISASPSDTGGCRLGYEVGEVAPATAQ